MSDAYREALRKLGYSAPDKQSADYAKQIEVERAAWTERINLAKFRPEE